MVAHAQPLLLRVFVAGASGAIGRPLVRALLAAGHQVTGMTRREERVAELRAAGATAVVCDALDPEALRDEVVLAAPEVVVHELTALPEKLDPREPGVYDATNRVRREGTANLVAAAHAAGATRMVAQSVAFLYEPEGDWVKGEEASPMRRAAGAFATALEGIMDLERQVLGAEGIDGLVLRYGFFYGPGTSYRRDGYQAQEVRRRRFPVVGRGNGMFSFVHVDDAAAATVAAVEGGSPGVYNVVDDEPARLRDWLPVFADAVGAPRPWRIPTFIARLAAGKAVATMATQLRGASNAKAKAELGWAPAHPTWRDGFRDALG
jgi:nucleoside-diphosphate-sugar epimerase